MESDGTTPAANYQIGLYPALASQAYARTVLQMERKLELGQEGHRYFDLQRWAMLLPNLTEFLLMRNNGLGAHFATTIQL